MKEQSIEKKMEKSVNNITSEIDKLLKDQIHPTKMDMVSIQIIIGEAVKRINKKYNLIGDEELSIHNAYTINRHIERKKKTIK